MVLEKFKYLKSQDSNLKRIYVKQIMIFDKDDYP